MMSSSMVGSIVDSPSSDESACSIEGESESEQLVIMIFYCLLLIIHHSTIEVEHYISQTLCNSDSEHSNNECDVYVKCHMYMKYEVTL